MEFTNALSNCRWTNIPQSDFTPPVETSKEELIASYDGPLLSDSFFIKYPWVLHDILVRIQSTLFVLTVHYISFSDCFRQSISRRRCLHLFKRIQTSAVAVCAKPAANLMAFHFARLPTCSTIQYPMIRRSQINPTR